MHCDMLVAAQKQGGGRTQLEQALWSELERAEKHRSRGAEKGGT
jgi:hypothetical protein